MKRAIFRQSAPDADVVYAIMGPNGAVVARIKSTLLRSGWVDVHSPSDGGADCAECSFLGDRPCDTKAWLNIASPEVAYGRAGYVREREALNRVVDGDWGPLLVMYADLFAPVEEVAPIEVKS